MEDYDMFPGRVNRCHNCNSCTVGGILRSKHDRDPHKIRNIQVNTAVLGTAFYSILDDLLNSSY